MQNLKSIMLFSSALMVSLSTIAGEHGNEIALWPDRAPGVGPEVNLESQYNENGHATKVVQPTLTVMKPSKSEANGTSVIVCPGGGYNVLAVEHEGYAVGEWLNRSGITAFVLQYRVPRANDKPYWLPPLQDAQRAISYVRAQATKWDLAPERIGILGFSAGGHLAATSSTRFKERAYSPIDKIDKRSCRPNFSILIYPAYITPSKTTRQKSEEITVTGDTPPAFLAVTADDGHALSSFIYAMALRKHNVPVELHVYPKGGHGYGLGRGNHAVNYWPERCERWMRDNGLLSEGK